MLMSRSLETAAVTLFGDPLRAHIVRLLATEQMCTCHLIEETGARQPTVSHHLRILREAGFVTAESHGRFTYYRLRPEALRAYLDDAAALAEAAEAAQQHRRPC
ncbi:metalloregulator ArsR/SmtB family transcription factor [Lipingzhangella sp. LS1_29]|uniref:Metalloregulator ArsR/SmtB family transcription factor n=1 Tax=Lipingzhangella rawalii TaxID=2055835 RepID=A0ABU2H689_9ACTN|nr:metalloregulator ArsR/SmtB family transcription factor [Lipingzhangella rawalii]MDS1270821.1 metalloregulator ArsR/SmtB family transcription factor [Lipingzhangella rawalii]